MFKRILKRFFIALGVLILLIICFLSIPFVLSPFIKDAERQDDSDIRPLTLNIPDADNAYFDLEKAAEVYATSTNVRDKNIESQLSKNAEALKLFAAASTKKYYQEPEYSRPETIQFGAVLPHLGELRNIAKLKKEEAMQLLTQGNVTAAINIATEDLKVGKLLQESQAAPITTLTGVAVAGIGHEAMQQLFADERISTYGFASDILYKEKYEPSAIKRDLTFRADYQGVAIMFDGRDLGFEGLYGKATHLLFWYKPNETRNMFADIHRYQIAQTEDCKNIEERATKPSPYQMQTDELFSPRLYITPNAVGKVINSVFANSGLGIQIKQCQSALQARNLAIAYALHAYQHTNGHFPVSLDQLVPNYIESIPVDPFTDQAPKYSVKDRTIYSDTYASTATAIKQTHDSRIYHF